jgi:hypothetical protein
MPFPKHLQGGTEGYRNADLSGPVQLRSGSTAFGIGLTHNRDYGWA